MAKPRVVKLDGDTFDVELSPSVSAVVTPKHVFVRWSSSDVKVLSRREAQILAAVVGPLDGFDQNKQRTG